MYAGPKLSYIVVHVDTTEGTMYSVAIQLWLCTYVLTIDQCNKLGNGCADVLTDRHMHTLYARMHITVAHTFSVLHSVHTAPLLGCYSVLFE